jgi:hypothetical protein
MQLIAPWQQPACRNPIPPVQLELVGALILPAIGFCLYLHVAIGATNSRNSLSLLDNTLAGAASEQRKAPATSELERGILLTGSIGTAALAQ